MKTKKTTATKPKTQNQKTTAPSPTTKKTAAPKSQTTNGNGHAKKADDGWQKIETVKKYFRYKECRPGQVLIQEGVYIGDSPNQFGRDNHDFKEKDGTIVCLNASGQLDYILQNNVQKGDTVRIVYGGKSTLEKGRYKNKEAHNFEVFVKPGPRANDAAQSEEEEEDLDEVNVGNLRAQAAEESEEEVEDDDSSESQSGLSLADLEG